MGIDSVDGVRLAVSPRSHSNAMVSDCGGSNLFRIT